MTYDAVIVGGGIVGCACAYFLSREFKKIAVVEPGPIGGGATAAGMGHLVVMDDSEPQFALTRLSCDLWSEIAPELPKPAEYERRGTLWVAADDEEMAEARRKREYYHSRGAAAEILSESDLAKAEPNLRKGLAGALLVRATAPRPSSHGNVDEGKQAPLDTPPREGGYSG